MCFNMWLTVSLKGTDLAKMCVQLNGDKSSDILMVVKCIVHFVIYCNSNCIVLNARVITPLPPRTYMYLYVSTIMRILTAHSGGSRLGRSRRTHPPKSPANANFRTIFF